MKARVVPMAGGIRWLREGWRLFRVSPLNWMALVSIYWLAMTAVSLVPLIGVAAATVLIPGFSVGFMAASRSCEQGRTPAMGMLFEAFRDRPLPQLMLGAVYLTALVVLLAATMLADEGALAGWMLVGARPSDAELQSDGFFSALVVAAGLYVPVMMLFWFAPLLAAWHSMSAGKALFYSFFACLLNWRAFFGFGALVAAISLGIPFLVLGALLVVAGGQIRAGAATIAFPLLMILLPVLLASFYASYRDVFAPPDGQ